MTLVDVRGSGDYALGHIAGSRWVSRGNLEFRIADAVPDQHARVVTVCDTGTRSTLAAATLHDLGYADVRVLEGGTQGWERAGYPIEGGLEGANVTIEEAKGDVETVRRAGVLERTRADMERYLSWEEELGKKYEGHHRGEESVGASGSRHRPVMPNTCQTAV